MITFVLLNWNSGSFLDRCVDALRNQTSSDWQLILVDNGSRPDSVARLRGLVADGVASELIELNENRGFAAGMNAGIARARGELVVPLNSDVCIGRNFVEAVAQCAAGATTDCGMWAVPEYVWKWSETTDELTDTLFSVGVTIVKRISVSAWHPAIDTRAELFGPEGTAPVYSTAALAAVRKADGQVFDESYGSYGEDIDLVLRLRAAGFTCDACLDTAMWHIGSASSGGVLEYNRKPPHLQAMVQLNRLRTYVKLKMRGRSLRILPWVLFDDLYRLVAVRDKKSAFSIFMSGYGRMSGLQPRDRYGVQSVRFAGGLHSRSGRLRARGPLPPLAHDLASILPSSHAIGTSRPA